MKFMFSGTMLRFVDYESELEISSDNFQSALEQLFERKPALRRVLLDGSVQLRRTHQVFLNGERIARDYYGDEEARRTLALSAQDSVYFLTAIAGG